MHRKYVDFAADQIQKVEYGVSQAALVSESKLFDGFSPDTVAGDVEALRVLWECAHLPELLERLDHLRILDLRGADLAEIPNRPGLILRSNDLEKHRRSLSPENIVGISIPESAGLPRDLLELPNLSRLDIFGNPEAVSQIGLLPNLRALNIGRCGITQLPDSVRALSRLEALQVWGTDLEDLPGWLEELRFLTIVGVANSRVHRMPQALFRLPGLRYLNFSENAIDQLPTELFDLEHLEILWLGKNRLSVVSSSIGRLANLTVLSLAQNRLQDLPQELAQLRNLVALGLAGNPLPAIPSPVFSLPSLVALDIGWPLEQASDDGSDSGTANRIREIPPEILNLEKLESIETAGQPIEQPPPEVVSKGLEEIQAYYRQLELGSDYLCEAKVLIVGEPGAGKTTLARKLRNPKYEIVPSEPTTEGIEVTRWSFRTGIRVQEGGRECIQERDLKVNIWDFGGQEIYHATHQFFLTRRSVYLLVADNRKEDTDFHYWLSLVELLAGRSPVLIVKNEREDRRREIDETRLLSRFGNVRATLATNLATNRGLDEVVRQVRAELERLPQIGERLPATWRRVRQALERDPRSHITVEEYLDVCRANGFAKREDGLQLSGFLHDLGICLHFQDDPLLSKTVILKTKWGTDAVYRLLDHKGVLDRHGRFDRADLPAIWHEPEYAAMRDELVQLMMKFELCYEMAEGNFIAPQLLEARQPNYEWDGRDNLVVKYAYEFMPKGILTRFIVATHHLIEDQKHVWKQGVVVAKEGGHGELVRCEVTEDYAHRQILVRVVGMGRRELLAIVDHELDRIHRSFPRLKVERWVPCHCRRCVGASEPQFHRYDALRRFATDRQRIQCQLSYEMVDAASLLDEVFPSRKERVDDPFMDIVGESRTSTVSDSSPADQVYLSYAWGGDSEKIANELSQAFAERGIRLVRDRDEVRYKRSIGRFMRAIGRGSAIVVVVSKKYLESKSCMFELTQIADGGRLLDRVFPVVLDDAAIDDAESLIGHVGHWEGKRNRLNEAMKTVDADNLQGIREDIDLYTKIRGTIARLMDILRDMNTLTPERHRADGFKDLIDAVIAKVAE
jgi:Leucine-rich repeat (LRR) protein/GTPase SAR1 family protein